MERSSFFRVREPKVNLWPKKPRFQPGLDWSTALKKGDMYFDGDHSQSLGRTLWVIAPNGSRTLLADGFVLYISLTVAARNLKKRGIPFRAISFYEGNDRQVVEKEISTEQSGARSTPGLILGLSNLWLGAIAGAFFHSVSQIAALGAFAFAVLAIITLRSVASIASTLITYAAGYLLVVLVVRSVLSRFPGR
jgi:hypothetical protein